MRYEIGKRYAINVTCNAENGTYCGPGSGSYYGVEFYFKDEDGNTLIWRTTGLTSELPIEYNKYRIVATVRRIEEISGKPWIRISHVKIKEHLGRIDY